jgi:hypothetical protein
MKASHVAQLALRRAHYRDRNRRHLPGDDINDDMIQHRFGENAAFAASVERETDCLFQVARHA